MAQVIYSKVRFLMTDSPDMETIVPVNLRFRDLTWEGEASEGELSRFIAELSLSEFDRRGLY